MKILTEQEYGGGASCATWSKPQYNGKHLLEGNNDNIMLITGEICDISFVSNILLLVVLNEYIFLS